MCTYWINKENYTQGKQRKCLYLQKNDCSLLYTQNMRMKSKMEKKYIKIWILNISIFSSTAENGKSSFVNGKNSHTTQRTG